VLIAVVTGCYSPAYRDCELTCAGNACPSGLSCEQGFCRTPSFVGACRGDGVSDASPDDGNKLDGDNGCGWAVGPSNVDACAIPVHATSWDLTLIYDTTTGTDPFATAPAGELVTLANGSVRVVRVTTLTASTAAQIDGTYPLIVLADTVTIDGDVNIGAGRHPNSCPSSAGDSGTYCGGGGAGGSFGGIGGTGGSCADAGTTTASAAMGDTTLVPLRGGCNGGLGGHPGDTTGGGGGAGGGALQISARTSMTINGTISAFGLGGGGGAGEGGNACGGNSGCAAGGGGGGAGGAILLESPQLTLASAAKLCATGGGGGGGALNADATTAGAGGTGTCNGGGGAGLGVSSGSPGGAGGGIASQLDGAAGGNNTAVHGGGGGGGAAGRIRVRTTTSGWQQPGATVIPAAVVN
jgi:hypothetical protein